MSPAEIQKIYEVSEKLIRIAFLFQILSGEEGCAVLNVSIKILPWLRYSDTPNQGRAGPPEYREIPRWAPTNLFICGPFYPLWHHH